MAREHRFSDGDTLADRLAERVGGLLRDAMRARGCASLIVSGGKTPLALFQRLSRVPLPWSQVWIGLADERWVDSGDPSSNERFVRENLLVHAAAAAHFIGMKNDAPDPAAGAERVWKAYERLPRPFDAVLLGIGDDGHTASLFPGNSRLPSALDPATAPACIAMEAPVEPRRRLSLNLSALIDAREIIISGNGESKWRIYRAANEPGSELEFPVRAILRQRQTPVEFYWAP